MEMPGQWLAFYEENIELSWVWPCTDVAPAVQEAEARGCLQPGCSSPAKGTILGAPPDSQQQNKAIL